MPKKVVLDTNMLLYIGKYHFDIFGELERVCDFSYKVYVLDGTIQELEKLINKSNLTLKRFAKLSLKIIKDKRVGIIDTSNDRLVDDLLLELPAGETMVVTQDKALQQALKKKGIGVLSLRQKKLLKEE